LIQFSDKCCRHNVNPSISEHFLGFAHYFHIRSSRFWEKSSTGSIVPCNSWEPHTHISLKHSSCRAGCDALWKLDRSYRLGVRIVSGEMEDGRFWPKMSRFMT
jgi:hypothetical protein